MKKVFLPALVFLGFLPTAEAQICLRDLPVIGLLFRGTGPSQLVPSGNASEHYRKFTVALDTRLHTFNGHRKVAKQWSGRPHFSELSDHFEEAAESSAYAYRRDVERLIIDGLIGISHSNETVVAAAELAIYSALLFVQHTKIKLSEGIEILLIVHLARLEHVPGERRKGSLNSQTEPQQRQERIFFESGYLLLLTKLLEGIANRLESEYEGFYFLPQILNHEMFFGSDQPKVQAQDERSFVYWIARLRKHEQFSVARNAERIWAALPSIIRAVESPASDGYSAELISELLAALSADPVPQSKAAELPVQ